MTDSELRECIESIAESSKRFVAGAELFAETANKFLETIGKSQEDAARMIAAQLRRSRDIRDMLQSGSGPMSVDVPGKVIRTTDGRIVTVPPNREK